MRETEYEPNPQIRKNREDLEKQDHLRSLSVARMRETAVRTKSFKRRNKNPNGTLYIHVRIRVLGSTGAVKMGLPFVYPVKNQVNGLTRGQLFSFFVKQTLFLCPWMETLHSC